MREYKDYHKSIMVNEVLDYLITVEDGIYVDCTAGEGGHSKAIYEKCNGKARVISVDVDYEVLGIAEKRLKELSYKIDFFKAPYQEIDIVLAGLGVKKVNGFFMDLGVSTFQLKGVGRGFTFMKDEPLDMRMDLEADKTAHYVVNEYSEQELSKIIFEYGEEFRFSRKIAKRIVQARPLNTTFELVEAIKSAFPYSEIRKRKRHFATKTFQAIRIEVNGEFNNIKTALNKFGNYLEVGGRVVVLSFHSLEDKIIKTFFKNDERFNLLTKKPLIPSEEEIKNNPRARSTKLRAAEKK
ncbi:ribosomal RNA small subunit methyltransferase H [Tepiditoga spiralis]|uniref:Ribosomal RNA small subunit methyltransferase H n=1 Tax=Tepiditoga spiralis TaxID=2108365 RepID=A0A7G1GA27_9BACT|nr:16S rRNA (cytosine(1402)-N(4))-methyltransferase RsmH [Tepiditoga spiralis]BBE31903.1 ribosomal RNA small subunit methyltransferase H [Tepiditoga spiralis]